MAGFEIIRHPDRQEITVDGDLTLALFREILQELVKADDFLRLHAVWIFGPDIRPLAFHEFDDVIAHLERLYARRPPCKRVALVVPGAFTRSVAEMFLEVAASLPVQMRIFGDCGEARAWIRG